MSSSSFGGFSILFVVEENPAYVYLVFQRVCISDMLTGISSHLRIALPGLEEGCEMM